MLLLSFGTLYKGNPGIILINPDWVHNTHHYMSYLDYYDIITHIQWIGNYGCKPMNGFTPTCLPGKVA